MFIDAVCIYGENKNFSVSINTVKPEDDNTSTYVVHNGVKFIPFDLSNCSIKFQVMGSATADAEVLTEHLITQVSDIEVDGRITDATNGQFEFVVTAEDTIKLGLGQHPIKIELVDIDTLENRFTLTEGGELGEFNAIMVVQV